MRRIRMVVAALVVAMLATALAGCSSADEAICVDDDASVARVWNEAALDAIRRDFPAPTVHARNLFHLSVAMWDAWVAYDAGPGRAHTSVQSVAGVDDGDRATDQQVAVAFAAYGVLTHRYEDAIGGDESLAAFDETLATMCLTTDMADEADSPAAIGATIAAEVLASAADDGSNEAEQYVAPYEVVNDPMDVTSSGTEMVDPNRWQQLQFLRAQTQNGQLLSSNLQDYVGPHWGRVTPFALEPSADGLPIDPGPPPLYGTDTDMAFREAAAEVVRASSLLDPSDDDLIDIGPNARGASTLGTNDGTGHDQNPSTGEVYDTNVVPAGDFYRVIAEFWADGPDSETPPGHWNTLANEVTDALDTYRIAGTGDAVDRLEWDVSMYLALNGALHDAAIAAWGAKAVYDYARPVSMIRYLAAAGELPLEPGLIEVITAESSAPGERHETLDEFVGEVAVRAWALRPFWFADELDQVRWIRAADWLPYQRPTFVTPAFPGYVSGHSTFSRAAAEVLASITGSDYFPGGLATHTVGVDELEFDGGPSVEVELQWATYFDAADEAGLSRIYGGIHVEADDLAGRLMGAEVGENAWAHALTYLAGE